MRAHLFDGLTATAAAIVLFVALAEGGLVALVAGLAAVFLEGALTRLCQAALDSLNPRTDTEAKYLRRVGNDILRRGRERELQDAAAKMEGP